LFPFALNKRPKSSASLKHENFTTNESLFNFQGAWCVTNCRAINQDLLMALCGAKYIIPHPRGLVKGFFRFFCRKLHTRPGVSFAKRKSIFHLL
ncbi:MAG: hypothetical protein FWB76_03265, partial [Oscillospiraceae bacterium]|nr:hypothetical protein [Oscillospiraceae bacterium]